MLIADGFDDAFLGIGQRAGQEDIAVYDFDKCVAILCERDGMNLDDAVDYMYFNVVGAWVGDQTPMFVKILPSIQELHDEEY